MKIADKIPALYAKLLPELVDRIVPEEKVATCSNCTLAMSPKSIHKNTKCCSYYPQIPNYLIGGLLQDELLGLDKGKVVARKLISNKIGISPFGINKPLWYKNFRKRTIQNPDHKNTESDMVHLLCPFYGENGECLTWAYREHCCSTHFCFSVGGNEGKNFWEHFMKYLKTLEVELAQYCLEQLGLDNTLSIEVINGDSLNADDDNQNVDESTYSDIWDSWNGKEEAFYLECHKLIENLNRQDFETYLDGKMQKQKEELLEKLTVFNVSLLPEFPRWNEKTKVTVAGDIATLETPDGLYEISIFKLPLLKGFNGDKTLIEMMHKSYALNLFLEEDVYRLNKIGVIN